MRRQKSSLIKLLLPFKNENRIQMAQRISKIVLETIKYDDASLEKGEIYPLSTTEVLSRKTGVCQHFANLFAALGRGVGLPTKIISGYSLDISSAGGHAWNEIEITGGVWLPIEPQSATNDPTQQRAAVYERQRFGTNLRASV